MKELKNEIKVCFTSFETEENKDLLSAQLHTWLSKAEEEMQYGDVNEAITIALTIIEEFTCIDTKEDSLRECYNKALEITRIILNIPSTRSDIKLLLEFELGKLQVLAN